MDENNGMDGFDISKTPFINTIWICKPASEMVVKITIFLPVILFGIFGNAFVLYILFRNQHIRTPTNLLIGNMAGADLLSILVYPWLFLMTDFLQNYPFGSVGCQGEGAIECSVLITSVISMSAITYDRLTAIVLPQETRLSKKGAKIVMVLTWGFGIVLSYPICLYRTYKERQWLNFREQYCSENLLVTNMYWYVLITVIVWLPLTIQIICYVSIFLKLKKYERMVSNKLHNHQLNYKKKAAIMMFVITITFMICRLPFTAIIIYRDRLLKYKHLEDNHNITTGFYSLWFISKYLIFVNTALNPIIYGVTNEKIRKAIRSTQLCKWVLSLKSNENVVKVAENQKSSKDISTAYSIFLIFKKKTKLQIQVKTPETKRTYLNTNVY